MNINDVTPSQNKIKGSLYFLIATLPVIAASFKDWSLTPPANLYAVGFVVISAISAGIIAVKAYLNQDISKDPAPEDMNHPVTIPVTVQPESKDLNTKIVAPEKSEMAPETPKP